MVGFNGEKKSRKNQKKATQTKNMCLNQNIGAVNLCVECSFGLAMNFFMNFNENILAFYSG